jgi:LytS/YehU family sensor histidine kinase
MIVFGRIGPRFRTMSARCRWTVYLGVVLCASIVGILIAQLVLVALGLMTLTAMWSGYVMSLEISAAIAVPCTVVVFILTALRARVTTSETAEQHALSLAADARFASLESRIRPHFLFNALNSAIALIPEDPRRAEDVLERLAALLRFSLDAQIAGLVPLREELRIVVDYLEIEHARFGERLAYEIDVPEDLQDTQVPTFAVQTLVENSVKYAVAPRACGARIVVRGRRGEGTLQLEVTDDGPGFAASAWIPGHGLEGLRTRLDAIYGETARLVAPAEVASGATVQIEVPVAA